MSFIKLTGDIMVKQLRWVMAGVIVFSLANTLGGQPPAYWHNAALALRGDGLSVNNPTNHTFEFFLANGWLPFAAASLVYLTVTFLLASVLPRKLALVFIFSVVFAHYYDSCNWLAVRWHLGIPGATFLGYILAIFIALTGFTPGEAGHTVKASRWIMLLAMTADATVTLMGQPTGYWHNPALVYEGNAISKFFMQQGWYAYLLEQAVIGLALYRLTSLLSDRWALAISFGFTFMGFIGSSNWLFYNWRLGWPVLAAWGCLLSIGIVFSIFRGNAKRLPAQDGPVTVANTLCSVC